MEKDIMQDLEFNNLKIKLFDLYFGFLNEMQRKAVCRTEGPLLVLAGAGSGKTTVIVNRIENLVKFGKASFTEEVPQNAEKLIPAMKKALKSGSREEAGKALEKCAVAPAKPYKVLCITFTNKAADEFKERLHSALGDAADDIWAGTFHSVCVRMLRRYIHLIGYGNDFTIYDAEDSKKLVKDVIKQLGISENTLPPRAALSFISKAKERGNAPEDEEECAGIDILNKKLCRVYRMYQERLIKSNALDFDDIIMLTNRLLRTKPEVLEKYSDQFDYILVDEYQDTNPSQGEFVNMLAAKKRNVCVVGDDDQSIYSFRGATIENILGFDSEYSDACVIKLEQNYRSTGNILKAANGIIGNNTGRKGKNLWTEEGDGEPIHIKRLYTQLEEADYIADRIEEKVSEGASYSDFAVLYRVNALSAVLETCLVKRRIPYRIFGGIKFYERREIKDILAYLSLMANPSDNIRLKRIINVPKRSIGDATLDKITRLSNEKGISMFSVIENANSYPELVRVSPKLLRFAELINDFKEFSEKNTLKDTVNYVIDKSGYVEMLEAEGNALEREQNIRELASSAAQFEETSEEPTLSAFLNELALVSDLDSYDAATDSVVLMTVHSAKGLEFDTVFVPGFEEGLFPSSQSLSEGDRGLEEERRLAYVAVTRAKKELYLLHASTRMLYGRTETRQTSRFAGEIPYEVCERAPVKDKNGHTAAPVSAYSTRHYESRNNFIQSIQREETQTEEKIHKKGTRVRHAIFGEGEIIEATPMGGDVLYEINFDSGSTKRLMGNYAHLTEVE